MLAGMRSDDGFLEWLRELLEPNGRVAFKRMFGGHGVYLGGVFVAIVVDGRPYFKADAETEPDFAAAGCAPFVYDSGGKRVEMSYWSLPESALDSAEDMSPWARRALAAAARKPAAKASTRARSGPSASTGRSAPRR
jgi:DNA transformation protein